MCECDCLSFSYAASCCMWVQLIVIACAANDDDDDTDDDDDDSYADRAFVGTYDKCTCRFAAKRESYFVFEISLYSSPVENDFSEKFRH